MIKYTYKNTDFYRYDDLKKAKHPCLVGTSRGIVSFCKNNNKQFGVDYLYAKQRPDGSWSVTKEINYAKCRDKVLISEQWVNSFEIKTANAPPLLKLEEHEMFRDCDGNLYEVEVRGERHHKKCYFKAKDISDCFDVPRLLDVIVQKDSSYVIGEDYMRFIVNDYSTRKSEAVYLTYQGLMRAAFVSRRGNSRHFVDKAMQMLSSAHLGTQEQRTQLASKLTGIDYETVKAFCDVANTKLSVIYLFRIGSVKDLRNVLDIPVTYSDTACVYKYGRTNDIRRRFAEHKRDKYAEKYGFATTLVKVWFVDTQRTVQAESELELYLTNNGHRLDNKVHTEIAVFSAKPNDIVKELDPLFSDYARELQNLEKVVKDLEDKLEKAQTELEHEKELRSLEKQSVLFQNDTNVRALEKEIRYLLTDVERLKEMLVQKDMIIKLLMDNASLFKASSNSSLG